MQTLRVHTGKRHLTTEDGSRLYLIGDTAWKLFHVLDREEAAYYLRTRQAQGFNMFQAVVLSTAAPNAYGRYALRKNADGVYDPALPDTDGEYNYYDHVEYIISLAEELGMYAGILPVWADEDFKIRGSSPVDFTEENARSFGRFVGGLLRHHNNIFWILGGDAPLNTEEHYRLVDAMAYGLKEGDGGRFLMSFHPVGAASSSAYVHGKDWLDFHMIQSGHGYPCPWCFDMIADDYAREGFIPVMDSEPCYEDHPINFQPEKGYFDAYDTRRAALWNLFGGTCGHTYGHHGVWGMCRESSTYYPNTWKIGLHRPGACWIRIYRDFIRDNDLTGFRPVYDIVEGNTHDCNYAAGMVSDSRAYLYIPCGIPVRLNLEALPFRPIRAVLFEPVTGVYTDNAVKLAEDGMLTIPGRACGRGMDAVVILT